jgi:hypothetical protein
MLDFRNRVKYAANCLSQKFIGADYGIKTDLTNDLSLGVTMFIDKYIPQYLISYPSKSGKAAELACTTLWTICNEIQKGDIVVCPNGRGVLYFGEIVSDYYYAPNDTLSHRRAVNWFGPTFKRKNITPRMAMSLLAAHKSLQITDHVAEIEKYITGTGAHDYNGKYFLVGAFWDSHNPQDMTELFVEEERWENGYDDKFISETKSVPEGSFIAIKSAYVRERAKSVMMIKARGRVLKNHGDGRNMDVEWEEDFIPFEVAFGGYMTTLKEVTNIDHIKAIWKNERETNNNLDMNNEIVALLKYKKQIIFQGPPGTGKTRRAKELATSIVKNNLEQSSGADQVKLIQFHASYSYEDFVRGIVAESKGNHIEYKNVNKILGKLAADANENWIAAHKDIANVSRENRAKKYFEQFADSLSDQITSNDLISLTDSVSLTEVEDDAFRYKGKMGWSESGNRMLFKDIIQAFLDGNQLRQDIKKNYNLSGLARQHASYFIRVVNMFREYLNHNNLLFDQLDDDRVNLKNYVLIIDEINRSNLSSVLGELIYALEYRNEKVESMYAIDGDNEILLPGNLYIIGTMNTADRSVGHIDYAIRRRFAFVDVMPEDLTSELGDKFHKALFEQVTNLFSSNLSPEFEKKDMQLGHSYFIDRSEEAGPMEVRLEYEIKPILMEYVKDGVLVGENIREMIADLKT